MPELIENIANEEFDKLYRLSKELHLKKISKKSDSAKKVIVFVGAGPSKAAGLPLGDKLKRTIYENFVGLERKAKDIFITEYKSYKGSDFRKFEIEALTLFEFAAILSRFAYGRKIIIDTIKDELKKATHRPLSYELLAHFAKHRYIDHFIILNFDRLLCEALEDELHESDLKIIRSQEDIPQEDIHLKLNDNMPVCYAIYPFGLLGEASKYSLTTDDVEEFGSEPVRDFIKNKLFDSSSKNPKPVILLLIGYRALEPAFERLLRSIIDKDRKRGIHIFIINKQKGETKISDELLKSDNIIKPITEINLDADLAFELLFELLKNAWGENNLHSWVSAARHRILSKLFNCANMPSKERFVIELLLQGIKSRGFIHFETFSKVPRLIRYSDNESAQAIEKLISERVLNSDKWLPQPERVNKKPKNVNEKIKTQFYVPNYTISGTDTVMTKFMELSQRTNQEFREWHLNKTKDKFICEITNASKLLKSELTKIQNAPDIEIMKNVEPEVKWILGQDAEELLSIDALKKRTEEIIKTQILNNKENIPVVIRGIWSTGEWLFWEGDRTRRLADPGTGDGSMEERLLRNGGWAEELGAELLKRPNVTFKILITMAGGETIERSNRRLKVIVRLQNHKKLNQGAKIELKWINWWEMNRIVTIVSCNGNKSAIYMRRRLNSPLVCPYYIPSEAKNALKYLDELWEFYWSRGVAIPPQKKVIEN
jgi:NAD-dependent SIR2 family protein deacetylase